MTSKHPPRIDSHGTLHNSIPVPDPRQPWVTDTAPEIEARQIEAWQRMSPAEKGAIVSGLSQAVLRMTWAGVRARHPHAGPREHFLRVAIVTLGPELACGAYPDAAPLVSAP